MKFVLKKWILAKADLPDLCDYHSKSSAAKVLLEPSLVFFCLDAVYICFDMELGT